MFMDGGLEGQKIKSQRKESHDHLKTLGTSRFLFYKRSKLGIIHLKTISRKFTLLIGLSLTNFPEIRLI